MCDSQVSEKIAISSRYVVRSSSPLSNSAMSLLKKYGAFFNPKLILRGLYVPKLVQKAASRCAVLLNWICQYPLDTIKTVINLAADTVFLRVLRYSEGENIPF
ncbi:hypothetical protein TNCV_4538311 [Trichonephila clavipes]|uniref:Uncharacterized protein n=1 Tax=Trichonephila clavipes TaxID=2585209 RepID=A0A8X6WEE1_TRICX|nr:hypothetical protein TNCV_4538311 [Trichonephila clavipes]